MSGTLTPSGLTAWDGEYFGTMQAEARGRSANRGGQCEACYILHIHAMFTGGHCDNGLHVLSAYTIRRFEAM